MPGGSAINGREIEIEIEQTRARLAVNEVERRALEAVLKDLLSRQATKSLETPHALIVADATMLPRRHPALTRSLYFGIYSPVAMTYFPSDGKTARPLSPAIRRHVPTSGSGGFAVSHR